MDTVKEENRCGNEELGNKYCKEETEKMCRLCGEETEDLNHMRQKCRELREEVMKIEEILDENGKGADDALTTILSALYAKLLVVLGIAFPITETIAASVNPLFYQGFYLYLYFGSIGFVTYMYVTLVKEKPLFSILKSYQESKRKKKLSVNNESHSHPERYGSLYLRLGAIAFGIGSMVYSGLEFGRYFELRNNQDCLSNVLQAVTPATRMVLTLVQIQFIFLNSKDIELNRHKIVARFGLMHMIATNLCEWLCVLVEETRHEIIHLSEHSNGTFFDHVKYCQNGYLMGSVVKTASTFLFPCTIEYSLICAVILYEMWKKMKPVGASDHKGGSNKKSSSHFDKLFHMLGHSHQRSSHHISIDCSNAHRGLFAGILVVVLTIISLIMFFVLNNEKATSEEAKRLYKINAEFEVNIVELILYIITTFAVLLAMYQMRCLKYDRKTEGEGSGIGLDNTLLVVAQTGMFIYCIFSIIGCYFTISYSSPAGLMTEVFSFIQTCLQTMFVLDGWWRRCRNLQQTKRKPGRELVTFLIIANMAMWTINTMEKNRAEFRPSHLHFFGNWAWTIITHISMPLAIFYRFHSTICLFEIWKSAYKFKGPYGKHTLLPYFNS
ncbi:hypothetical protein RN001_003466 [Aquatica leii]|uniref:Proton channel OtopLc-like n=1 Tax=Aquatica leii TaxID=1421715 RepID=A0AAN7QBQ2_9COLE|nr:hypothetical protein RN001_003466 [Aquatica leii]